MHRRFCIFVLSTIFTLFGNGYADAQSTSDNFESLKAKFQAERAEAIAKKFPESSLTAADELAKRAETSMNSKDVDFAVKCYRQARWLVPYVPADLPPNVDRVLGISRLRHGAEINKIVYSPDGKKLASASKDSTVKIWDLGNGRDLRTYRASKEDVRALAWSSDGKMIASSVANDIHVWDPETGNLIKTLKGHQKAVSCVAFSPDNKSLVSGSDDFGVRLWDIEKGESISELNGDFAPKAKNQINAVCFSPNGKLVAAVNGNGQMQIWNPSKPKKTQLVSGLDVHAPNAAYQVSFGKDTSTIFTSGQDNSSKQFIGTTAEGETLPGHGRPTKLDANGSVYALAISPDSKFLATGGKDKAIRLWDLQGASPRLVRVYNGHSDDVTSLAFSPDGKTLASAGKDQSLRFWTVSLSDDHSNFQEHTASVWSVVVSGDGKLIASAGADRQILVRDATGKVVQTLSGNKAAITSLAFGSDHTTLVSVGGDKIVRIWNAVEGKLIKELTGHEGVIMASAIGGPGGKMLVTGGIDKIALLWDFSSDKPSITFPAIKSAISSISIRPDGQFIALGSADGIVSLFAIKDKTATLVSSFQSHSFGVGALAFSPDGGKLATCGGDNAVKVWSIPADGVIAKTKQQTPTSPTQPATIASPTLISDFVGHSKVVSSVAFSPDGRLLVSGGGDQVIRIWEIGTNRTEIRALRGHHSWISSVVFSPNGQKLISASMDKSIKIWELGSSETSKPVGHTRALTTIAISADGRWVASGSEDKTIKLWDAVAGIESFTLDLPAGGHEDEVTSLSFDPKGEKLVSSGYDGKIILWDLATRKPIFKINADSRLPFLSFNAKGDRFIAWQSAPNGGPSKIVTYDLEGKQVRTLDINRAVSTLSISTDGEVIATGFTDGTVQVWRLSNNEKIGADWPASDKELKDLGITPDQKKVAIIDVNGKIKIYDIAKKAVAKEIESILSTKPVGLIVSPDGSRFTVFSETGEVKLIKLDSGEELRAWRLPTPVRNAAFSTDGKKLITANGDTTISVLNLP